MKAAAHCYEELLLLDPYSAHVHSKLAETYYTIGSVIFEHTFSDLPLPLSLYLMFLNNH